MFWVIDIIKEAKFKIQSDGNWIVLGIMLLAGMVLVIVAMILLLIFR